MKKVDCADGGTMCEVYADPAWGQLNVRTVPPGGKAGGHRHPRTDEWWFLARGRLRVRLERMNRTVFMEPGSLLPVPAGEGHAVENAGDCDAVLVFWRSRLYDPEDLDKEEWDGL
jgi:mannose-6-phosphate isomerase-like protein (cupin superfamily)